MRRFLLVFVLLLAACGAPNLTGAPTAAVPAATSASTQNDPCSLTDVRAYQIRYNDVIDEWGQAVILAGQSKPADLQGPIGTLQKISDQLAAVQPPLCAKQAHDDSLAAMTMSIGGYKKLLDKQDVGTTLREAIDKLAAARTLITALPGQPDPTATPLPTFTPAATFTPIPTPEPTATAVPTATPLPRKGIIGSSRAQVYETATSDTPIKTLLKNTEVQVFEAQKGRIHIRAGAVDGWVPQSSVVIK